MPRNRRHLLPMGSMRSMDSNATRIDPHALEPCENLSNSPDIDSDLPGIPQENESDQRYQSRPIPAPKSTEMHVTPSMSTEYTDIKAQTVVNMPFIEYRDSFSSVDTTTSTCKPDETCSDSISFSSTATSKKKLENPVEPSSKNIFDRVCCGMLCCGRCLKWSKKKRCAVCCGITLIIMIVQSAVMMTVGVQAIAQLAINNWYPSQFDIHRFKYEYLRIGPMRDNDTVVSVYAPVPEPVPVHVAIMNPMVIQVSYLLPPPVGSAGNTPPTELPVGVAQMLDDRLDLYPSTGYMAAMNVSLRVEHSDNFVKMVDHILTFYDQSKPLLPGQPDYYAPVVIKVDVVVSSVKVILLGTSFFNIQDLFVNKTILLKVPKEEASYNYTAQSINDVGSFFGLVSKVLVGDSEVLNYATRYMSMGKLMLYDKSFDNPPPAFFRNFSNYEYDALLPDDPYVFNAPALALNQSIQANSNVPSDTSFAGIVLNNDPIPQPASTNGSSPLENILGRPLDDTPFNTSAREVPPQFNQVPSDSNSLPFALNVTFKNPTNIQFLELGWFFVALSFNGTVVANVSIPNMHLDPLGVTTIVTFGYLRRDLAAPEYIETVIPNAILKIMFSGQLTPLPFTLGGLSITPSISNYPPVLVNQTCNQAIQSVLANRLVAIGEKYTQLSLPGQNGTANGLAELFSKIRVLGYNKLADVLQGIKLKMGFSLITGKIPVTVFLANPFTCAIGIVGAELEVYSPPGWVDKPMGYVYLFDAATGKTFSDDTPANAIVTPPILGMSRGGNSVQDRLKTMSPQFSFQFNMRTVTQVGDFFSMFRGKEFLISLQFKRLTLRLGRMQINFRDISKESVANIPLFRQELISQKGFMGMVNVMRDGWDLIDPQYSAYPFDYIFYPLEY